MRGFETAFGGVGEHQGVGADRGLRACVERLVGLVEHATLGAGPVQRSLECPRSQSPRRASPPAIAVPVLALA